MSTIRDMITDTVYRTMVAEAATYIDQSGAETDVRVVPQRFNDDLMIGAEVGVRGAQQQFFLRKSSISHRPCEGDQVVYGGVTFCVARQAEDYNENEWLIDVRT